MDLHMIGRCPKCDSEVVEGGDGYYCSAEECKFKIGRTILGQQISPTQAARLLRNGRTDLLDEFISKAGRPFAAFLVMDGSGKVTFEFAAIILVVCIVIAAIGFFRK
jgi:DNA topoisomerase III